MKKINSIVLLACTLYFVTACGSSEEVETEQPNVWEQNAEYQESEEEIAAEAYIEKVDNNDSLRVANSLYYTKPTGEFMEVTLFVDDSNKVVKVEEEYNDGSTVSVLTNLFYYKNDTKYASKEYFEQGEGQSAHFVERVSYYNAEGKPAVTKQRTAQYEDGLVEQLFSVAKPFNADDSRAFQVLNQEGQWSTTFQGIVRKDAEIWILVGEDREDGYASALLVNYITPLVTQLINNEKSMLGTPVVVQFDKLIGEGGFEFQTLMHIEKK